MCDRRLMFACSARFQARRTLSIDEVASNLACSARHGNKNPVYNGSGKGGTPAPWRTIPPDRRPRPGRSSSALDSRPRRYSLGNAPGPSASRLAGSAGPVQPKRNRGYWRRENAPYRSTPLVSNTKRPRADHAGDSGMGTPPRRRDRLDHVRGHGIAPERGRQLRALGALRRVRSMNGSSSAARSSSALDSRPRRTRWASRSRCRSAYSRRKSGYWRARRSAWARPPREGSPWR